MGSLDCTHGKVGHAISKYSASQLWRVDGSEEVAMATPDAQRWFTEPSFPSSSGQRVLVLIYALVPRNPKNVI